MLYALLLVTSPVSLGLCFLQDYTMTFWELMHDRYGDAAGPLVPGARDLKRFLKLVGQECVRKCHEALPCLLALPNQHAFKTHV